MNTVSGIEIGQNFWWHCPNCTWIEKAHPHFGWQIHNERAVEVHLERLCPALKEVDSERPKAKVILFKDSGKYYTEEEWLIPTEQEASKFQGFRPGDMAVPYCMNYSPDFRRISNGKVLVVTQEPWGYPHLL
jgi:hypothetical protein